MIILLAAALLLDNSHGLFVNTPITHTSDVLRIKCDELLYRTHFDGTRCYFAVSKDAQLSEASAQCSLILTGAQISLDAPSAVYSKLMVDRSAFHVGKDSSGAKQSLCIYDSGYTCEESEQSQVIPGKCFTLIDQKMTYPDAVKQCGSKDMEIASIGNDLENRMIRGAVKDFAWIRNVYSKDTARWTRDKHFGRFESCTRPSAFEKLAGVKGRNDMSSIINSNGYWTNKPQTEKYAAVCVKDAEIKGALSGGICDYHQSSGIAKPLPPAGKAVGKMCYTASKTSTRYDILGKSTIQTPRGCELLCNVQAKCVAFSFKDAGLNSSCVLLSTPAKKTDICDPPTTVFLKQTTGCVARTNFTAEFGDDPCVDEIVPSAFAGLNKKQICPKGKYNLYIIRAIDTYGRRISLDNEHHNYIRKVDDMFEFVYDEPGQTITRQRIIAFVCARAAGVKCPCSGLVTVGHKTYGAKPERLNPCNTPGAILWYNVRKSASYGTFYLQRNEARSAFVTCRAGMWILWRELSKNSWGVTGLGCAP